ncbi:hypothetical protein [Leifsonia sp. NPDC058248]|uniref:hypothetical protein n=1 Tax=Leifsonia sp. NPDC058248 TaxID=3346402 RepID=UPI0036DEA04E
MSVAGTAAPDLGRVFPGWALRAAFAAVAVGLCVAEATAGFWLGVSLLLAAAAVAMPRWLTAWFLIGVLAFTVLLRDQSVADWHPYVLIAGVHLLHILGSWMLVVAPSARVQPAALWPSARRFVLVQAPVQLVAAGALALASAFSGASVLGLAVVAGAGVLALAVALAAPLLVRPRG